MGVESTTPRAVHSPSRPRGRAQPIRSEVRGGARASNLTCMDPTLQLISETGIALRREMLDLGTTDKDIRGALRGGLLHRVRQGAYTTSDHWNAANEVERHRLRSIAVSRVMGGTIALTHTSALTVLGIDVWGADLSRVHVTRRDGSTGRECAGVIHHEGTFDLDDVVLLADGTAVSSPTRAVIEHASLAPIVSGIVSADNALNRELTDDATMVATHRRLQQWPGMRHVQLVVRLADGRSESVGETRMRHLCWRCSLPAPELQYEVFDAHGRLVGRTDFAWPRHRLFGEFDGRGKYLRSFKPGQSVTDVVLAEKRREDRIRELTGFGFVRVIWPELAHVSETGTRIRRLLQQAA